MRVMVLVKATDDSEKGILPTTEMFEAMGKYNEELINAGIMRAADGLKPSSQGKRIAFDGPAPHGHRRAFRRNPRVGRRLLAVGSQGYG